jgi:Alpha-(1,6)-fucosyltransferase N- and catalytic domains
MSTEEKAQARKFLVIRAYPAGMASCIRHILNNLIYAELTQRIPIVWWQEESLYYEFNSDINEIENNAFEYYFEPVSKYSIEDIIGQEYTYFPSHWNDISIIKDYNPSFFQSAFSLPCLLIFPGSDADVLVSAFWQETSFIQQMIAESNSLNHLSSYAEIYYYCFSKYIKLKKSLMSQVDLFCDRHMNDCSLLGVHVRRTDKVDEIVLPNLNRYTKEIDKYLASVRDSQKDPIVFLATDSNDVLKKLKKIYKDIIVFTDCIRSDSSEAVHLTTNNKRLKGEQILIDMYLLSRCDMYIGLWFSNITPVVIWSLQDPSISEKTSIFITEGLPERLEHIVKSLPMQIRRKIKQLLF